MWNRSLRLWNIRDSQTHIIETSGFSNEGRIKVDMDAGLLDVEESAGGDSELTLKLQVQHNTPALSRVLALITGAGGEVLRCHTEQDSFDRVFYSVLGVEEVAPLNRLEANT